MRRESKSARVRRLRREKRVRWLDDPYLGEVLRKQARDYRNRVRDDPIRLEQLRERQRVWAKAHRAEPGSKEERREGRRALSVARAEGHGRVLQEPARAELPVLPAEPFRRWLVAYGLAIGEVEGLAIALNVGIEPRRVTGVLAGQVDNVSFDIVDRALINARFAVDVDLGSKRWPRVVTSYDVGDLYPSG